MPPHSPFPSLSVPPAVSASWLNVQLAAPQPSSADLSQEEVERTAARSSQPLPGQGPILILDCRFNLLDPDQGHREYLAGHLPGAIYWDLNQDSSGPVQRHGGRHPLPAIDTVSAKLTAIGLTAETLVVAYDASRFAFAARLWWLLRYLGHDRVTLLDGGWPAWQAAGYPVSTVVPEGPAYPLGASAFVPQVRTDWVVDRDYVIANKDHQDVLLIDSREGDRYRGEREPIDPVAGHIPGAVNYCWQDVTTSTGQALSPDQQRQHWDEVTQATEAIVYCGSGVTACVNLWSLAVAGVTNTKLYAGSWSDWCSYL